MVSVCVATFNGERFITEQLNSILVELTENDEVIVSDDGSTDATLIKIKEIGDPRIRIIHHAKSLMDVKHSYMYTTLNFENALKHCKGDYIYLSDQDDIWKPGRIQSTQQHLQNYSLVCCDCEIVNSDGHVIQPSYFDWNSSGPGLIKNMIKNSYLGCCMAFKRELLHYILPMSVFNVPHDIWIGLISEKYGCVYFDVNKLIQYRRHGNNLSPSGESSANSIFYKLSYRWIIIRSLFKRIFYIKKHENFTVR